MSEADVYRRSRESLTELFPTLTDEQLRRTVSETPDWTVREVLGHLVGGAEDHVAGDNEDAPSAAWTARHVARLADLGADEPLPPLGENDCQLLTGELESVLLLTPFLGRQREHHREEDHRGLEHELGELPAQDAFTAEAFDEVADHAALLSVTSEVSGEARRS